MTLDADLRAMAEHQHGVLSRTQARALGATTSALRNRLTGPSWDAPTARVLRLVGAPRTARQDVMVAVLDAGPGALAGHSTAAALWQLPGFTVGTGIGRIELVRERGRSGRQAAVGYVRECRSLPLGHRTERDGIPVTSLPRTLFDIAADVSEPRLERLVDTVVSKAPGVLQVLHAMLDELGARGRNGIAAMRSVLKERPPGYVAPASGLEARLVRILAEAGQPPLDRQVDVGGHEWIGRVDFVDRRAGLLVEVDSARHHTSKLDRERDRRRDAALLAAGWNAVIRVYEDQVWHRPWEALAAIGQARRHAA